MRLDPKIPCLIIISPNAAFVRIKDGNGMYLGQAVAIFLAGALFGTAITSSGILSVQLDLSSTPYLWRQIMTALASGVITPAIIHIAGKRLGGNQCWKKTFDAILHIHILYIPVAVVFALAGAFWLYYSTPFESSGPVIGPPFFFYMDIVLHNAIAASLGMWILIVTIKAVKVVNAFGTAKAFGVVVAAIAASWAVTTLFSVGTAIIMT